MTQGFILAAALLAAAAPAQGGTNPLEVKSTLPFEAPPFDKIKDADYQPAIERGIAESLAEIRRIADNPAPPTFENTIVALERQGQLLERTEAVFNQVVQANSDPELEKTQAILAPKLAAYEDAVYLDRKLFERVKTLYDARAQLKLDQEQAMVLEDYHTQFIRAGAQLSSTDQDKLRSLNTELSTLQTTFQQKLLAATKAGALKVADKAALEGLTPAEQQSAARDATDRGAPGAYLLPLQNTTLQPALQSLRDRGTRETLLSRSLTRAELGDANDTRDTIASIAELRIRKANLLGYATWADYALADEMAKTSDRAKGFMNALDAPTSADQKREAQELQAAMDAGHAGLTLKPWDWPYYAEQVRKARYDLDENETKPYLELWNVLENGVFYAANQMYGLTFKRRLDIPTYQPDMRVYEAFDADGKPLGLAYFDYWKRDNKSGGAWMDNYVTQSKLLGTKPVISNTANFTKPAPGQPALITFEDVRTMFHEFGHGLHGLFANQVYPRLSGTSVARDFVEFPSQFNEHWALDPKVLAHYARDYRTGAPMPQALVDKIKKSETFNQAETFGELLAAAQLDMAWHSLPAGTPKEDVDAFEGKALASTGLDVSEVPPRYRSSYFAHIWGSGYSAGYYAYIWTDMLQQNVFDWFEAHGGMTRENGQRFRDLILSKGHTEDYDVMFRRMVGHDPEVGPLLVKRGLAAP